MFLQEAMVVDTRKNHPNSYDILNHVNWDKILILEIGGIVVNSSAVNIQPILLGGDINCYSVAKGIS